MTRSDRRNGAYSRRQFLAASAALLAAPAVISPAVAQSGSSDVDVAIIGAGAAGIAAARKVAAAGRSYVLLEASTRIGGRARTVTAFGQPFDLGVASFSRAESTLAEAAEDAGLTLTPLVSSRRLYADGREADEASYDAFTQSLGRIRRDIVTAGDAGKDVTVSSVDSASGPWAATAGGLVGPLSCGAGLDKLSTLDLSLREPSSDDVTSPMGVGAMLEALGAWLNVQTNAAVTLITNAGRYSTISLRGQRGIIRARAIVLAVPASAIASGDIRLNPMLMPRWATAYRAFSAGAIEHVAFSAPDNPLQLGADERVLARIGSQPSAELRARINGSDLHVLTLGDTAAREIAEKGEAAALRLTRDYLSATFGSSAPTVDRVVASGWWSDPLIRGAMTLAPPGQAALRRQFADPVGRIFLAGEYTTASQWGTLAGAWNSGEVAAAKALTVVSGPA